MRAGYQFDRAVSRPSACAEGGRVGTSRQGNRGGRVEKRLFVPGRCAHCHRAMWTLRMSGRRAERDYLEPTDFRLCVRCVRLGLFGMACVRHSRIWLAGEMDPGQQLERVERYVGLAADQKPLTPDGAEPC